MSLRAVRGATQLQEDTCEQMLGRVAELVTEQSLPRVARWRAHVEPDLAESDVTHPRGAAALHSNLTRLRSVPDA